MNNWDIDKDFVRNARRGLFAACALNALWIVLVVALVIAAIWALLHLAGTL